MSGTSRLGTNPLEWIQDSSKEQKNVQSNQCKQSKQKKPKKSSTMGLRDGWTRATLIVRESVLEKAKDLAYWERKKIQEVIDEALSSYFSQKKVRSRPKKNTED